MFPGFSGHAGSINFVTLAWGGIGAKTLGGNRERGFQIITFITWESVIFSSCHKACMRFIVLVLLHGGSTGDDDFSL